MGCFLRPPPPAALPWSFSEEQTVVGLWCLQSPASCSSFPLICSALQLQPTGLDLSPRGLVLISPGSTGPAALSFAPCSPDPITNNVVIDCLAGHHVYSQLPGYVQQNPTKPRDWQDSTYRSAGKHDTVVNGAMGHGISRTFSPMSDYYSYLN